MKQLLLIICFLQLGYTARSVTHGISEGDRFTVNGYVKDARTGEMLVGATILVTETGSGTITNPYGFFSISLPPGTYVLQFDFLGYVAVGKEVSKGQSLTIALEPDVHTISEVEVVGEAGNSSSRFPLLGLERMESSSIRTMPVLLGETDPMKALQLLPGVSATSEGSSNFSVRGGNPDQNLLLLDEAIVYNAGHLLGFFSVFNNDAIKDLELYKGDLPASAGGRLSSVLDVRTRDGNMNRLSGIAGIGLISSRLTLEGPIVKEKASFLVSGRRTYLDLFLPLSSNPDVRDNSLYFYDLNMKVNWVAGDKDRFFLGAYLGRDVFKDEFGQLDFGNRTFTFRWNRVISPKLFANLTLVNSRYDYFLGTAEEDFQDMNWRSLLTDYMAGIDFSWYPIPKNTVRFGAQVINHQIEPGLVSGVDENSIFNEIELAPNNSYEYGLYVSNTLEITPKLVVRLGLRYSRFQNVGEGRVYTFDDDYEVVKTLDYPAGEVFNTYHGLEPRGGVSWLLSPRMALKTSYSKTRQYIQLASNSTSSTPLDIWFSASPNVQPQVSDQVSMGLFHTSRNGLFENSIEVFYKRMNHTIDFKDHPDLILNETLELELRPGKAMARGLEWMTRWNAALFNGWVGYTWSHSERQSDEINNGQSYLSPYDHSHDLSVFINYQLSPRVRLSGNWVWYTGAPVTFPEGRFEIGGEIVAVYSDRNANRMPDYHRLDLSMSIGPKKRSRWKGEWVFSLYNAYGRKNAWAINFVTDEDDPYKINAEKTYLFSVVPSISYTIKF